MKILVQNLNPNPYRNLQHYPVDKEKIDRLKQSIEQTGFWDNILCRKHGDKYQLAYGHHRLEAIRQLGVTEIDIPCKDISDADMVRIMALENREQEDMSQSILIETVRTVRDFLNGELAGFSNWSEFSSNEIIRTNFSDIETEPAFRKIKGSGVGQTTILKFLGGGWKQWKIQSALDSLNSEDINIDAVTRFNTTGMAEGYKRAIRDINKESSTPVPLDKQIDLAEKVKERLAEQRDGGEKIGSGKTGGSNYYGTIKDIIKEEAIRGKYITPKKTKKEPNREKIIQYESYIAGLRDKINDLREDLRKLQITEQDLEGIEDSTQRKLLHLSLNGLVEQINLLTNNNYYHEKSEQSNDDFKRLRERFEE